MGDLFLIVVVVFAAVGLMVVLGERFARPPEPALAKRLNRWLIVLVALMLGLSVVQYYR